MDVARDAMVRRFGNGEDERSVVRQELVAMLSNGVHTRLGLPANVFSRGVLLAFSIFTALNATSA
jgi:hypothetical protein